MRKKYNYLIGFLFLALFSACNEEEVQPFSEKPGVNFMERVISQNNINWGNGYTNLNSTLDFAALYSAGNYGITENDIILRVQLEGQFSATPLKVKFTVLPVEEFDLPHIIIPADGVEIKAGEYFAEAVFTYKRPETLDKEYRAKIAIDYENSDVVAGTKERQTYTFIIQDMFKWEMMSVESREEWDTHFTSILGVYGPEKVRFLLYAFGKLGKDLEDVSWYTVNNYYPTYYGLQKYMPQVREALATYNTEHPDAKVQEADGTLVTFPEP